MKKRAKAILLAFAVASTSTTYVSCSTAAGRAFRDAAINGAAGVLEDTVAGLFGDLLAPVDATP